MTPSRGLPDRPAFQLHRETAGPRSAARSRLAPYQLRLTMIAQWAVSSRIRGGARRPLITADQNNIFTALRPRSVGCPSNGIGRNSRRIIVGRPGDQSGPKITNALFKRSFSSPFRSLLPAGCFLAMIRVGSETLQHSCPSPSEDSVALKFLMGESCSQGAYRACPTS
jgi:hypothetical protein